jgi:hypothetical protein
MGSWRIILLIPAFFCANFFYSYQQNNVNGKLPSLIAQPIGQVLTGL